MTDKGRNLMEIKIDLGDDDDAQGPRDVSAKKLTHIIYALYAAGFLTGGFTTLAAIVMNYVKRDAMRGSWIESHFRWQIRTFWFGLLWSLVGLALAVVAIGFAILIADGVWVIYRIVKGWLNLIENKPMYGSDIHIGKPGGEA